MYNIKDFRLPQLEGLSEKQTDVHLGLYAGYVKNVNAIEERLAELNKDPEKNSLFISELTRRFPFEWNGMRMHEYYFDALGGNGKETGEVVLSLEKQFGSFTTWLAQFRKVGGTRGIGWTVLTHDAESGRFANIWVGDHEIGQLAGADIILAMDMWEHAYLIDYLPSQKADYISAFFKNLKWAKINERYLWSLKK